MKQITSFQEGRLISVKVCRNGCMHTLKALNFVILFNNDHNNVCIQIL